MVALVIMVLVILSFLHEPQHIQSLKESGHRVADTEEPAHKVGPPTTSAQVKPVATAIHSSFSEDLSMCYQERYVFQSECEHATRCGQRPFHALPFCEPIRLPGDVPLFMTARERDLNALMQSQSKNYTMKYANQSPDQSEFSAVLNEAARDRSPTIRWIANVSEWSKTRKFILRNAAYRFEICQGVRAFLH